MNSTDISFFIALAKEENGLRIGYDKSTGLWTPHKSIEGGTDTIAYGHKLTKTEQESEVFKNGIDTFEAVNLLVEDFNKAWDLVEEDWDKFYTEKFFTLPREYQYVLAELCFNTGRLVSGGKWKWPALANAIRNLNDQKVYEEAQRYYFDKNRKKIRLTNRVIEIHRALGLVFKPLKD